MILKIKNWFYQRASQVELVHPFDDRSRWTYRLLVLWILACFFIFCLSDFHAGASNYRMMAILFGWMAACGLLARRYGHPRVALFLEACSLPAIIAICASISILAIASISRPFVDDSIVNADAALFFDWRDLFKLYMAHPWLFTVSEHVYGMFGVQALAIPIILFFVQDDERFWTYILATQICLAFTTVIFPVFPAAGPYIHFGIDRDLLRDLGYNWNMRWEFAGWIEGLRNGDLRDVTKTSSGIVSIPSFHAAAGILYIWACFDRRHLRWPIILLNTLMIFSALVADAHYLTDLITGIGLAIISIFCAQIVIGQRISFQALGFSAEWNQREA